MTRTYRLMRWIKWHPRLCRGWIWWRAVKYVDDWHTKEEKCQVTTPTA